MKQNDNKVFILHILLVVYIALKNILFIPISKSAFTYIINPIFWIFIGLYCNYLLSNKYGRYKNKNDKVQIVIIILLTYLILYFSLGLILGYQKSPYSHDFDGIYKNIFAFTFTTAFLEYARFSLIKSSSKKILNYIYIVILFSCIEINFGNFIMSLTNLKTGVEYVSSILIPLLAKNALLVYLVCEGGYIPSVIYSCFLSLIDILLPIFPNLNWFLVGSIGCTLPLIVYLSINNFINKRDNRKLNVKVKERKIINSIPIYLLLIALLMFFCGKFKYMPVGVMSNSMAPTFVRGDAVVVEKINDTNINNIEIGTVIMYNLDNISVIHRVIEIHNSNGEIKYKTKGDNNNGPDTDLVSRSQIVGIKKISIPKIGYPSVIIQSIFTNNKVNVETGK